MEFWFCSLGITANMSDHPDVKAVESFDRAKLKKVQVVEKNSLPTAEDIAADKISDNQ